jgi:DNA-binding MarR family transcriptional regulator
MCVVEERMSASDRKAVTFRLTAECRRLLAELASAKGISQAAVLELLLREEARREARARKVATG